MEGRPTKRAVAEPGHPRPMLLHEQRYGALQGQGGLSTGEELTGDKEEGFQDILGQCRDKMERDLSQGPTMGSCITGSLQQPLRLAGLESVGCLPKVTSLVVAELVFEPTDLHDSKAL